MAKNTILWTALLLALISGVQAADISLVQGDPLIINADSGVRGYVDFARATFSMPAIGYFTDLKVTGVTDPKFQDKVIVDAKPGTYPLSIRIEVEGEVVEQRTVTVEVKSKSTTTNNLVVGTPTVSVSAPSHIFERITVPPIPDLSPGETFILPITVRGNGVYMIEIPSLPFGSYEIPNPVEVNGEKLVPVLIKVYDNAEPGTYMVPVYMAGEQFPVRVRVISYTTKAPAFWISFIILGVILIIISVLIAILSQGPRNKENNHNSGKGKDNLITYY